MTEDKIKPCPHIERCCWAAVNCTKEHSTTCPVITKAEPAPEKEWDPLEPVAITLTMEQWLSVRHALQFVEDAEKATVVMLQQWPHVPSFCESAARRKAHAEKVAGIREAIEKIIGFD